jgi:transketolase N-terminal domain/subunit
MDDQTRIIHAKAMELSRLAIRATTTAGSGHPTTALSLAHLVTVLMYRVMRWTPSDPGNKASDRLVLSEGHAVPIIYAACADLGVTFGTEGERRAMTESDLMTLREIGSPIDGHPNPVLGFPFFDAATGSLGQGLSVAAGLACAARVDGVKKRIFCLIGDGESREGQIWEAMDFSAWAGSSPSSTAILWARAITFRPRRTGRVSRRRRRRSARGPKSLTATIRRRSNARSASRTMEGRSRSSRVPSRDGACQAWVARGITGRR